MLLSLCLAASCSDTFVKFANTAPSTPVDITSVTAVANLSQCQQVCLQDPLCIGLNWIQDSRPLSQKCALYSSSIYDITPTTLFDLYLRQMCVPQLIFTLLPGKTHQFFTILPGHIRPLLLLHFYFYFMLYVCTIVYD